MTKKVLITIEGQQLGAQEEAVIITTAGTYYLHEGNHYIKYEEKAEEEAVTKSTIKIAIDQISLIKKGANSSEMIFNLKEETLAIYQTPYGNLSFDIKTTKILVEDTEEMIQIKLEYSLATNGAHLSDNRIKIVIDQQEED